MTLDEFNQLPYQTRLAAALHDGAFLATRWQEENEAVNLYELGRFFVEVTYDTAANELLDLRSFSGPEGLEDYAIYVRLPDWLNE